MNKTLDQLWGFATVDVTPPEAVDVGDHPNDAADWLNVLDRSDHPLIVPLKRHVRRTSARVFRKGSVDDPLWQQWAWRANAIWIDHTNRHVLDPAGRLLLAVDSLGDPNHTDPAAVIPSPIDARQRQAEVAVTIRNRLIDPIEGLVPVPGIDEVKAREPSDVARRIVALFLVATRAESVLNGQTLDADRMRVRCPIGYQALSPREKLFFDFGSPTAAESLVWRYENLFTLQWALGMQFELPWPDEHADLMATTRLMVDLPDESIVEQARLRSTGELLDATELHHQLYYSIAFAQSQNRNDSTPPGGLDEGVVCERMVALAWLLNLNGDWDTTTEWVENGMMD